VTCEVGESLKFRTPYFNKTGREEDATRGGGACIFRMYQKKGQELIPITFDSIEVERGRGDKAPELSDRAREKGQLNEVLYFGEKRVSGKAKRKGTRQRKTAEDSR